MDPLQTLQAALAVPANSSEQADILNSLRDFLETHPGPIQVLVSTLINGVVNAGDSLLKRWVIELFHFAVGRADISIESKTQSMICILSLYIHIFSGLAGSRYHRSTHRRLERRHRKDSRAVLHFSLSTTVPCNVQ